MPNAFRRGRGGLTGAFCVCSAWTMVPGTVTPASCITKGDGSPHCFNTVFSAGGYMFVDESFARAGMVLSPGVRATCINSESLPLQAEDCVVLLDLAWLS